MKRSSSGIQIEPLRRYDRGFLFPHPLRLPQGRCKRIRKGTAGNRFHVQVIRFASCSACRLSVLRSSTTYASDDARTPLPQRSGARSDNSSSLQTGVQAYSSLIHACSILTSWGTFSDKFVYSRLILHPPPPSAGVCRRFTTALEGREVNRFSQCYNAFGQPLTARRNECQRTWIRQPMQGRLCLWPHSTLLSEIREPRRLG